MTKELTTLDDLTEAQQVINQLVEASHGEIGPDLDKLMGEVEIKKPVKLQGYYNKVAYAKLHIGFFKDKEDSLRRTRKALEAFVDWANNKVKNYMMVLGIKEANGTDIRYQLQSCKPRLVIDETKLPQEWKLSITTWVPDRERISDAVLGGVDIPGCSFEGGFSIRTYPKKV